MARTTTGPRLWTHPKTGIHHVRFTYRRRPVFESTGTRNLGEAQEKAAIVFAQVVSGQRSHKRVQTTCKSTIEELGALWLAEVGAELSNLTCSSYEGYLATHIGPFFKTLDRVNDASALDYRLARLRQVQRGSVNKELSCLRKFLGLPVCRLMPPLLGYFCRVMPPPDLQGHAATSERDVTSRWSFCRVMPPTANRFLQGDAARRVGRPVK